MTEPVTLEGKDWARLSNELDIKIKLKKREKNVLFIFRANFQNADKVPVHFRLLINDKEVTQMRTSSQGSEVDSAVGTVLVKLDKGKHKVILQYFTSAKIEINVDDFEGASLQAIQMEVFKKA